MGKQENAAKTLNLMEEAWKTKSAILMTEDYVYFLYQLAPNKWKEVSFIFNDASIQERDLDAEKALMFLIEEITTGLPGYDDFTVVLDNQSREQVKKRLKDATK